MEKYNEMKVYRNVSRMMNEYVITDSRVFTCRGVACDAGYKSTVVEELLLYTGDCPVEGDSLYRVRSYEEKKGTYWYRTENEAWDAAALLKLNYPILEDVFLNTDQIEPLGKEVFVNFQLDENGRPYVRLNAHPERDGRNRRGKIFFPDRSFVGADLGNAVVSISKEFDTYGFLTGKMNSFEGECPSMKEFLDWAWENEKSDKQVLFINHPGRGRYIAIADNMGDVVRIVKATYDFAPEQHVWRGMKYDEIVKRDAEQYTERKCTLTQLYLEDAWGMEVDLDAILKKFDDASFLWNAGNIWTPSIKFWGSTIDAARKYGFLEPYCVPGRQIEAIDIVPERMDALSYLTREEVRELTAQVNKINAAAKEKLLRLLKKA